MRTWKNSQEFSMQTYLQRLSLVVKRLKVIENKRTEAKPNVLILSF